MPVIANVPNYRGARLDSLDKFHGNMLVYINWVDHLLFCAPLAFPLPPSMPFGVAIQQVAGEHYGQHPEWASVDWTAVKWELNRVPFTPDFAKSLEENGVDHKSVIRFTTPGLTGIRGSYN